MFPHLVTTQDIVDLLPYEPCSGCHLHGVIVRVNQVSECTTNLFGDWELIGAGVACSFIIACLRGYDKDVSAIGTEEHHDKSYPSFFVGQDIRKSYLINLTTAFAPNCRKPTKLQTILPTTSMLATSSSSKGSHTLSVHRWDYLSSFP
jgi:hypothetical protein